MELQQGIASIMSEFHTVARVTDIPEGEARAFAVEERLVAVFHDQGEFTAINDACPHAGASLASGHVEQGAVICPWHAWRFSVKDGCWLDNPTGKVTAGCHDVRIVNDEIQVKINEIED